MGQYGIVKCPICYASIETEKPVTTCPACKERIAERLEEKREGVTTATADGPGLKPAKDLEQDVY